MSVTYLKRETLTSYQVCSHCKSVPGWSWYVRSSKIPPSVRGGMVGQKANSWQSCWLRDLKWGINLLYVLRCYKQGL